MADTSPGIGASRALNRYWTSGEGLARWASSPHPYTKLVKELRSEGVPAHMVHGLAAEYYHRVFGRWPGRHDGAPGHGKKLAMDLHPKDRGH